MVNREAMVVIIFQLMLAPGVTHRGKELGKAMTLALSLLTGIYSKKYLTNNLVMRVKKKRGENFMKIFMLGNMIHGIFNFYLIGGKEKERGLLRMSI